MKVEINDIKSIDDLTVSQYKRFIEETKGVEEESAIMLKAVEIFLDIDPKVLYKMPTDIVLEEAANIFDCMNQKPQLSDKVTVDGVTYSRIPDINALTFGQYIDLEEYIQEEVIDLGKIMAVLWNHGKEYTPNSRIDSFPLGQALESVNFFFKGEKDS